MRIVLVFQRRIHGFRAVSSEKARYLQENLLRKKLSEYLKESGIRVESIVEKTILSTKKVEMFLGFVPEDSTFGDGKLAEDFVETGKYLKVGRRAYANHLEDFKRINAYMKCNNIRTDGTIVKWKDSRRMGRIYFRISN
ncbi:hypothetical protein [Leptospira wolffii]|uniref:hypothetical protein n=1 Tax=Leptospira wolffii TaxID=409998 RepID=UPI00030EB417|nr:hypothetical protein [Leptospira wolffii]EPG65645.1 hypothetical protein LEP1GSC061_1086 [Leptospira wolffii serovar Khorat str. Khorat-H2]